MGMTLTEFRKSGWAKEFAQFDEAELATILLCVKSLCEIGCWTELVHYCAYRIEESIEEAALEELDEDSAVVH
tara:strand:+ start:183 stop:401 length:219 start_codon:yes stop_codon:yes gene_type:complete